MIISGGWEVPPSSDRDRAGRPNSPLDSAFYDRDTAAVARDLLGKVLARNLKGGHLKGRIVETEAYYGPSDPASHASSGKTDRSAIMWESPGVAYVYFVYGNHYLLNAVTQSPGQPGAVLIRALEPMAGMEAMKEHRGVEGEREFTNGPGKLCEAMEITKEQNGTLLTTPSELWIEETASQPERKISSSPRMGIKEGLDKEYRFYFPESPYLSRSP